MRNTDLTDEADNHTDFFFVKGKPSVIIRPIRPNPCSYHYISHFFSTA